MVKLTKRSDDIYDDDSDKRNNAQIIGFILVKLWICSMYMRLLYQKNRKRNAIKHDRKNIEFAFFNVNIRLFS